jgi:NitT/TauT family transport system substrate-binding protein
LIAPKKRSLIIIAVIILIVVIVSSSFVYLNSPRGYVGKVEPITFGDLSVDSSELIYIAQDQNFFANNGINLTIKNFDTAVPAINSIIRNEVDLTTSGEYPFVANVLSNQNFSIIGTADKFQAFYLIGNKDHRIESISDLKGKNIGVVRQSLMEFYLGRFLEMNGLNIHDVSMIDVRPAQWANAIANGTVDAIAVNQAYLSQVQARLTDKAVVWQLQSDQLAYGIIFGTTSWITQHSDIVNRFLKSLFQAEDYLMSHEANAKVILKNHLNYTDSYLAEVWPNQHFSLSLDKSLVLAMENEARWMISNNLTNQTRIPDFQNSVYVEGLDSIDPDSVNIIR